MADNKTDFEIFLKSKWDGDAMKAAEADFRKTQKAVKETKEEMGVMGQAAGALKTQLAGLLAFAEVVAQFKEGFEQVAALEQAMNQLERAAKRNGDNFGEVKEQIVGMANALKKAAGVDDDLAIKKMSELYNATGDVANAMALVALATDVAVGAGMDLAQATDLVSRAAMGQTRGLKELNISIEETGDKTDNANKALAAIQKNFGGAAKDAKGLKVEIDRLSEAWEDLRNNVVEKVSPALYLLIKGFNSAAAYWSSLYDLITTNAPNLGAVVLGTMRGLWEGIKGNTASAEAEWAHVIAVSNKNASQVAIIGENLKKKLAGIWGAAGSADIPATDKPHDIVSPDGKGGKGGKKGPSVIGEMFGPTAKEKADYERELKESLKQAQKAHDDLAKQQVKADGKEIDEAEKLAYKLVKIEEERAAKEKQINEDLARAKMQAAGEYASAAVDLGNEVFGASKELAVAGAIVNTYRAATEVLPNYVLAALVIATGLAQVARIISTNPAGGDSTKGSGFDDPGNDAAARLGGRRWAADAVSEFSSGARAGWAEGMRGIGGNQTTTNDNRRTFNVHMHGAGFIDPTNINSMKQFHRALQIIDTQYAGQRTVARAR